MAIGTVTLVSKVQQFKGGTEYKVSFAGDGAYPTGGTVGANVEAAIELAIVTANALTTDKLVRGAENLTIVEIIPGDCGQYVPSWTGGKLKVRDGGHATWDEVTAAGDLSATTFNITAICK